MRIAFKINAQIGDDKINVSNQAELIGLIEKLKRVNDWLTNAPFPMLFDDYFDEQPVSVENAPSGQKKRLRSKYGTRAIDYIVRSLKPLQDVSDDGRGVAKQKVYEAVCNLGWTPKSEDEKKKMQVFDLASGQFPDLVVVDQGCLSLTENGRKHFCELIDFESKQT